MARSTLILSPGLKSPRFVRESVSGARPTLKLSLSKVRTVRQAPLQQMLSPMWQSSRIGAAFEIVKMCSVDEVEGSTCETVATCSTCG